MQALNFSLMVLALALAGLDAVCRTGRMPEQYDRLCALLHITTEQRRAKVARALSFSALLMGGCLFIALALQGNWHDLLLYAAVYACFWLVTRAMTRKHEG